jgi:hypothetical protein
MRWADMNILFTAKREVDSQKIYLLECDSRRNPYVVCWNVNTERGDWDWGTYCDSLLSGLEAFVDKVKEHEFTQVYKGNMK